MSVVDNEPLVRPALRRRTEDRLVSGVAGGLADWLNASPLFVRVVLALLFTFDPVAWAYAGATLMLPARGHDRPGWDNLIGMGRLGLLFVAPKLWADQMDADELTLVPPNSWLIFSGLALLGRYRAAVV